jgi:hypothetical protein
VARESRATDDRRNAQVSGLLNSLELLVELDLLDGLDFLDELEQ